MTVRELIAMLQRKVAIDPTLGERTVYLEGCDCGGECVGMSRDGEDIWLRREEGVVRGQAEIET